MSNKTVWVVIRTHSQGWEVAHCSPSKEMAQYEASRLIGTGGIISLHLAELKELERHVK